MKTEFFDQFFCYDNGIYSIAVEDDGNVAYAYLLKGDDIIGDVWLYNQSPTPKEPNWNNKEMMPFLNPQEFIKENISPVLNSREVRVDWKLSGSLVVDKVLIYVHNKLVAMLKIDSFPGWSTSVIKDGPLAKVLDGES